MENPFEQSLIYCIGHKISYVELNNERLVSYNSESKLGTFLSYYNQYINIELCNCEYNNKSLSDKKSICQYFLWLGFQKKYVWFPGRFKLCGCLNSIFNVNPLINRDLLVSVYYQYFHSIESPYLFDCDPLLKEIDFVLSIENTNFVDIISESLRERIYKILKDNFAECFYSERFVCLKQFVPEYISQPLFDICCFYLLVEHVYLYTKEICFLNEHLKQLYDKLKLGLLFVHFYILINNKNLIYWKKIQEKAKEQIYCYYSKICDLSENIIIDFNENNEFTFLKYNHNIFKEIEIHLKEEKKYIEKLCNNNESSFFLEELKTFYNKFEENIQETNTIMNEMTKAFWEDLCIKSFGFITEMPVNIKFRYCEDVLHLLKNIREKNINSESAFYLFSTYCRYLYEIYFSSLKHYLSLQDSEIQKIDKLESDEKKYRCLIISRIVILFQNSELSKNDQFKNYLKDVFFYDNASAILDIVSCLISKHCSAKNVDQISQLISVILDYNNKYNKKRKRNEP